MLTLGFEGGAFFECCSAKVKGDYFCYYYWKFTVLFRISSLLNYCTAKAEEGAIVVGVDIPTTKGGGEGAV
jgi:hypothetical protein